MDCRLIEGEMGGECAERVGRSMWMLSKREFFKGFVDELNGDLEVHVSWPRRLSAGFRDYS